MLIPFLMGLLVGFLINIPIGPLNLLVANMGLRSGLKAGLLVALGGCLMEMLYLAIIMGGLTFIKLPPNLVLSLKIVGILFLFGFGIKELFFFNENAFGQARINPNFKKRNMFILGVLIYLANPTMVVTLTGVCAFIKSFNFSPSNLKNAFIFAIFSGLGAYFWFYLLLKIIERYRFFFSPRIVKFLNQITGLIVIFLALFLSYGLYFQRL